MLSSVAGRRGRGEEEREVVMERGGKQPGDSDSPPRPGRLTLAVTSGLEDKNARRKTVCGARLAVSLGLPRHKRRVPVGVRVPADRDMRRTLISLPWLARCPYLCVFVLGSVCACVYVVSVCVCVGAC